MLRKWRLQALRVVIFCFFIFSCSSASDHPTSETVTAPDLSGNYQTCNDAAEAPGFNPHSFIGSGQIYADTEAGSFEIIPARLPSLHLNLRQFLEDGAPCSDCFKISSVKHNPDNTWDLDLQITHPVPGDNTFTVFDMRLIMMFRGTKIWPASGLESQDPEGTGGYALNPDGYTTIFNPLDFPPGSGPPFLTYTQGKMASLIYPDSTLNPYMDYYNDGSRYMTFPGQSVTRTWTIKLPTSTFILGYAVDCCWAPPTVDPPLDPQHDFPPEANKPEPFWVIANQPGILGNPVGSHTNILVASGDWQGEVGEAWIECPDLWTGKKFHQSTSENPPITTYIIPVTNETGAPEGTYRALIGVTDPTQVSYPWDYTTYTFIDIQITQTAYPCCATAPVAVFDLPEHLITGQEISLISESYDPDGGSCSLTIEWDLDGDGAYDDAIGDYANTSFPYVGFWQVGIQVTDSCDLTSTLVKGTQVHAGITMQEDSDFKVLDTRYNLIGADLTPSAASASVDLSDTNGPWDFTGLPLTDTGNNLACISPDNPDVQSWAADITDQYFFFFKGFGTYNGITGSTYFAQRYDIDPDRLVWVGMYQDSYLGTYNFLPPMFMDLPFWIFSQGSYSVGIAPYSLSIDWEGWGEGRVTVPFEGITNAECVVLRYKSKVGSPDINGGCMIYQWILDDGASVAYAVVANFDELGIQNFDEDTWTVTGQAHFAALSSIEPY
ncbi:MAG: hypothetical protein NTY09_08920 [bacterium]|nr:hypothetical protein [bacterium]